MRAFSLTALLSLLLLSAGSRAFVPNNDNLAQGVVNYKVDANSLDPSIAQFLQDMAMVVLFSPEGLRAEVNMGMMGTTTTIVNGKTGNSLTLMNIMGNKIAVDTSEEEADALDWKMEKTEETKTIAGYVCNKVKLVSSEATLTYYVTDKIQAPRVKSQLQLDKLEGFPLQMELSNNGMSFVMVAQSVKTDAVDASRFSMSVPMGYTKMTQEELMQMFGNLGGGQ